MLTMWCAVKVLKGLSYSQKALNNTLKSAIHGTIDIPVKNRLLSKPMILKREVAKCKHTVSNVEPRKK